MPRVVVPAKVTQCVVPAKVTLCVIPAQAGTQGFRFLTPWIPAYAGMTIALDSRPPPPRGQAPRE